MVSKKINLGGIFEFLLQDPKFTKFPPHRKLEVSNPQEIAWSIYREQNKNKGPF